MARTNIAPPIRTPLLTQNGAPLSIGNADIQTMRDWWFYWKQVGDQGNANSKLASEGGHADRPVTDSMPDGAIYIESDRGVIYQNQGGNWQYVAGVMYGTLAPDQRPADLGVSDDGFEFRATDSDPTNTGREFVWSGTAWEEITPVLYNTHALRPAPAAAPARCIYVETDRGAIYQNQFGVWLYLAGTMWGTLVPDQRPTDLGIHDAGFDFRSTQPPPREFVWNQTAWVETTSVSGAVNLIHPNVVTKVGSTQGQIVEGGITDESAANSGWLHITPGGNVGIAMGAAAAAALDVAGTVRSTGASSTGSGAGIELVYSGGSGFLVAYDRSAGAYHSMQINGAITILPSGNVGIGTGSPGSRLSVAGLPTSSAGLVSGDIWRDPSAANVLKVVP